MNAISYTEARQTLAKTMERVCNNHMNRSLLQVKGKKQL